MSYRCPRLRGCLTPFFLLLLTFALKVLYGLNFTKRTTDFDFHRHWQEVTINLPPQYWYKNTPLSDMTYCPFDYPVFAAYVHWLMGTYITRPIVPEAVLLSTTHVNGTRLGEIPGVIQVNESISVPQKNEKGVWEYPLQSSREHDSIEYFILVRYMFAALDTLVYGVGSLLVAQYYWGRVNSSLRFAALFMMIMTPHLLIIDHGNTQTNSLAIGLFLLSLRAALSQHYALSASIAILSSMSKQTVICVFPPFAIYVLSRILRSNRSLTSKLIELVKIATAVVLTTALLLYPLLVTNSVPDMMNRVFPPYRRIMEEISPSFWNLVNAVKRIRYVDPLSSFGFILKVLALALTATAVIPGFLALALNPTKRRFLLAIQISSLSAFLFGYCIHSKALIYALVPMHLSVFDYDDSSLFLSLLASFPTARFIYFWCEADLHYLVFFSVVAPLYFALNRSLPHCNPLPSTPLLPSSFSQLFNRKYLMSFLQSLRKVQLAFILLVILILEICEATLTKPESQPGIFIAISHVLLFFHFLPALLLMNFKIWESEQEAKSISQKFHLLPTLKEQ